MNTFFKTLILPTLWLKLMSLSLCGFLFLETNISVAGSITEDKIIQISEAKQKNVEEEEEEEDDDDDC